MRRDAVTRWRPGRTGVRRGVVGNRARSPRAVAATIRSEAGRAHAGERVFRRSQPLDTIRDIPPQFTMAVKKGPALMPETFDLAATEVNTADAGMATRAAVPRSGLGLGPDRETWAGGFAPSGATALIGPEGLRLADWRADGAVTTIKAGPHRIVYRAELPGRGAVYIKHFLVPNVPATLRQWFRRGKGRNEAKRAALLAALGVPTITPIALGEQRRRGFLFENYLVTPEISGTIPLDAFVETRLPALPSPSVAGSGRRLAEVLGDLTARLHEGGILHTDFHPGNLLVRVDRRRRAPAGDDRPRRPTGPSRPAPSGGPGEPGAAEPLLLDPFQPGRSLPLPPGVSREVDDADPDRAPGPWPGRSRRPPAPGPSGSGGAGGGAAWGRTSTSPPTGPVAAWSVAHRDLDPEIVRVLMADPDAPFARPDAVLLEGLADDDRRRGALGGCRADRSPSSTSGSTAKSSSTRSMPCSGPQGPGAPGKTGNTWPAGGCRRRGTWRSWPGWRPGDGSCRGTTCRTTPISSRSRRNPR